MTETHYRRLLRLYPAAYRREYADEMVAVLMADDRPGPGAVVDLVRSALAVRFHGGVRALREPAWRQAAAVVQLVGAILLLAVALRRELMNVVPALLHPEFGGPGFGAGAWLRSGVWLAVIVCALFRARALGLLLAAAGLAAEIAVPFREYADTPARVLDVFGLLVVAALVALTFLVTERFAGFRIRVRRGWLPATLAGVAVVLDGGVVLLPGPAVPLMTVGGRILTVWSPVLLGAAALLLVLAAWHLEPAVRRRVVACAVPVLVTPPSISLGFGGFREYNVGHPEALHRLGPVQWLVLLVIPAAAFAVAVELNRRLEDTRFRAGAPGTHKGP